ncbi:MAG TPA: hypothetical protein ENN95_01945 [Deltaproteobacteria bacterium]|nr:hypothetical protein [Deltaproteobacteria bacterium]
MTGGIYSRQRCPVCGNVFNHKVKDGLVCAQHPTARATRFIVKFKKTFLNFKEYSEAERFLTGLRWSSDQKVYDRRDYQKSNPLGFTNLYNQYFQDKTTGSTNKKGRNESKIKKGTLKNYQVYKRVLCDYFKDRNIKEIAEADALIADFFNSLTQIGNKTKHNYRSHLNDFFTWVWQRNRKVFAKAGIAQPILPKINYILGYRKLISKEAQYAILQEVKRISYHSNPKIYLGIKWLCTYIKVRPGEMIALKEADINLSTGHLYFPAPKENQWKAVALVPEDIEILKTFPLSLPGMPFFRHQGHLQATKANQPFGEKYFYKWWKKACENLGINDIDLYGGTKHSSVTALRNKYSPDTIKTIGTGHKSNKAFDRYLMIDADDARELYANTLPTAQNVFATTLQPGKKLAQKGKLLKL